ncbi:MAG: PilZ domain-containing protein, partial [Hyphomicrobium sp.]|uniref:PilZ domain-containing protein n=1 Tax=Hyphomicrobium sp. TaxID=82 RepID=UPI003D145F0D
MTSPRTTTIRPLLRPDARIVPDRRRHRRYALALLGRFMRANKQEYPCRLNDVSVGGASLMAPVEVELGERIVA